MDIINAQANSQALLISNDAKAQMLNNTITYQSMGYSQAEAKVKFQNTTNLLDYIFYVNLMNLNKNLDTKLLVGVGETRVGL